MPFFGALVVVHEGWAWEPWLKVFQREVANVAKLVHLGQEEFKIGWVFCSTVGQVKCMNLLVLHNDELNDFALNFADDQATQL